jgi:hypothetical protein
MFKTRFHFYFLICYFSTIVYLFKETKIHIETFIEIYNRFSKCIDILIILSNKYLIKTKKTFIHYKNIHKFIYFMFYQYKTSLLSNIYP